MMCDCKLFTTFAVVFDEPVIRLKGFWCVKQHIINNYIQ